MPTFRPTPHLLLLILLLAGLHAASASLIRPLFQVSDEVTYLASLERSALARPHDAALGSCLSPPDGAVPPWMPAGGKWLFHVIGATWLRGACEAGAGFLAPLWLRLAFGLSLPVVAWAAWHSARLLTGGTWTAAVTALAIATEPVMAKYAGAISPDSLANASAALAILVALRTLVLGPTVVRCAALLAWTGIAVALKDSTLFLLPVHGLVLATVLVRRAAAPNRAWFHGIIIVGGLLVAVAIATVARPSYALGPGLRVAMDAPLEFMSRVTMDTMTQLPSLVSTSWTSLGVFGGTSAPLPVSAAAIVMVAWIVAAAGWCRIVASAQSIVVPGVAWYLGLVVLGCLLQAPARQVLLQTADIHQGRWLFPVAVPIALALAVGLEGALARHAARAWPLIAIASMLVMSLPWLSVAQWHVADSAWALDRAHLFLYSTGGLDIGPRRVEATLRGAWPAARNAAMMLASLGGLCAALMLRLGPPQEFDHVRHADHR